MNPADPIDGIDPTLGVPPRAGMLEETIRRAIGEVAPAKPLAPPPLRAAVVVAVGLASILAMAHPLDHAPARLAGFTAIVLLAGGGLWLALALAVPGAGAPRRVAAAWLSLPAVFAIAVLAAAGTSGAPSGAGCLVAGLAIAALPLVVAGALVRRAFPVVPRLTGAVAGVSAGLFGLGLLHLDCPVVEGPHLAIFHGGVLAVALAIGAAGAALARR